VQHNEGERRIKALQKELLAWIESHRILQDIDPMLFNDIRHRIFRSTFQSYKLGIVGLTEHKPGLFQNFFGWIAYHPALRATEPEVTMDVAEHCFVAALKAFQVGVLVGHNKRSESNEVQSG
jgi:hypothetical protein